MVVLLFFAFISGLVTILAPCIWPLLPIVLSSTSGGGKSKPLGITLGIVTSFALFTLTISYLVKIIPFDPNILRLFAVSVIGFLGLTLVVPALIRIIEGQVSRLSGKFYGLYKTKDKNYRFGNQGLLGGLITGLALGVIWSPCAGPILATIATLAATRSVNAGIILVTFVYAIGVAIPLFVFATAGSKFFSRSRIFSPYTGQIQRVFGVIMILTALAIFTNYDKVIQIKLLDAFPSYSNFLFKLESGQSVRQQLDILKGKKDLSDEIPVNKNIIMVTPSASLPNLGAAPEFTGIHKWLNLSGGNRILTMRELRGKVVLVDFWTYTCINCVRTLPYVTGWYEKYKDKGFSVIGVHTPEFEFEKNTENVTGAIKQYNIRYPVAQDNDYETWNAYGNHYWPAKYLIDANGNISYTHFGEGEYETTEMQIKILLKEAGENVDPKTIELKDMSPKDRLTPETYLGSSRSEFGTFNLKGKWNVQAEFASPVKNSGLEINFYADKVYLVISPKNRDDRIRVLLDGKTVDWANAGKDVKNGYLQLNEEHPNDLYNLIDLKGSYGNHLLRLEFETEGTKIFAFTFG